MAVNPKLNPFVRSVGLSFWRSGIRVSWCPGILASWHLHIVCVPASHKQQSEHKQRWRQCQSQSESQSSIWALPKIKLNKKQPQSQCSESQTETDTPPGGMTEIVTFLLFECG